MMKQGETEGRGRTALKIHFPCSSADQTKKRPLQPLSLSISSLFPFSLSAFSLLSLFLSPRSPSFERARLRFAHAETVLPFTCLLGLFLEGSDFEKLQKEQPLQPPPKPPSKRNWRGGIVAPFAGNNMLALYQCPSSNSGGAVPSGGYKNEYFVQVLHNEIPVKMPGCDNADFCPFKVFKEKIVDPHLKYDFNLICNTKLEAQEPCSFTSKFFSIFQWLFLRQNNDNSHSHKTKAEL